MAQPQTGNARKLHPVQKLGHHAWNKSTAFGELVQKHPLPAAISFLLAIFGFPLAIWGIWLSLSTDVKPQVAAVVDPATAAIQAEDDKNTKEILDHLNAQLAAQAPSTSAPKPKIPKSTFPLSIQFPHILQAPPPIVQAVAPVPISQPRVNPLTQIEQAPPPPSPVLGFTAADEKTMPIAIRAQQKDAPGHFLDGPTASTLYGLLDAEKFHVFDETNQNLDESKIDLFLDILNVASSPLEPSPSQTCDGEYIASVENITVQISIKWNNGVTLYSPNSISGTGFGCPDRPDYVADAYQTAETDAAQKINSQFLSLISSK